MRLLNFAVSPLKVIQNWLNGLWNLVLFIGVGVPLFWRSDGGFESRLLATLNTPRAQRYSGAVARAFAPNVTTSFSLLTSYQNNGTAFVTRRQDVLDVLSRDDDFEVVYGTRMRKVTEGEDFFLGLQPGWPYTRDVSAMRLAVRGSDVAEIVLPQVAAKADELVGSADGSIDLPAELTRRIPPLVIGKYFGTPGPTEQEMIDWMTVMFWYLFVDLSADPEVEERALTAAAAARVYLDDTIAERKANPTTDDDVLNRCLALQSAGTPGLDDLGIRNNLLGLLIGAVPSLSKAAIFAIDELLRRPDALAGAQRAARTDDDPMLGQYIWEALRFNPHQPVIYRRATRDSVIAPATLRRKKVRKDTLVLAVSVAAAFDTFEIPRANSFRVDRPSEHYLTWGYGMHKCFGAEINRAAIPAILKPVLQLDNLRRAPGEAGQMDTGSTPFPKHMTLEFDKS